MCLDDSVTLQSSNQPQEVLLAQFSLYVHKGGLKPHAFHFLFFRVETEILGEKCHRTSEKCAFNLIQP